MRAVEWLAGAQSGDGGWGDAPAAPASLAATTLARAAIYLAGQSDRYADVVSRAQSYLDTRGGQAGMRQQYRANPAFLAAVMSASALAGLTRWRDVPPLAFERAWLPRGWQRPAGAESAHAEPLRAGIGQARYFHRFPRNPAPLLLRRLSVGRSLKALSLLQPPSGGFLESAAWSSFVVMGLASTGRWEHPTARRALAFLLDTVRDDASWPNVTSHSVGNTAFAVNALASASGEVGALGCLDWLLAAQKGERDVLPGMRAGGWARNDGRGSLANTTDTAAALMALSVLLRSGTDAHRPRVEAAATAGINWLLALQNDDGGWPTYFRGARGGSPDASAADLTAEALRALHTWQYWTTDRTIDDAIRRGMYYLVDSQQPDGSWPARWFGNANLPGAGNSIFGTSRVVLAFRDLGQVESRVMKRGLEWLAAAADPGGGWGGGTVPVLVPAKTGPSPLPPPSAVEATAMAVEALLAAPHDPRWQSAAETGLQWLVRAVEEDRFRQPALIGLHPPQLGYAEKVYPLAFTVSALGQAVKLLSRPA